MNPTDHFSSDVCASGFRDGGHLRGATRVLFTLLLAFSAGCGGRTIYELAEDNAAQRSAALNASAAGWESELRAAERPIASARMVGHHVYAQARPDVAARRDQLEPVELIDGEPALEYPRSMRRRERVTVVLGCIVETTGLVSNCLSVAGPEDLSGYVRRTMAQWAYLPAIGTDGHPHASSLLVVLPFAPY